jgi:exodeoxyribonuclease VII large subunit
VTLFSAKEANPARRVSLVKLSGEIARALVGVGRLAVEGEVHQPSRRPGGRGYFTLRDRVAQIPVTFPASRARRCRTVAGERVLVTGALEWVSQWGRLQLVAEEVVPVGAGAVAAAIAEARARLQADGLLDRPRRPLPRLPVAVGVVCGNEAAVRADIESVVAARFPGYPVEFLEVTVSGSGAAEAIVFAVRELDARPDVEVIVLARGGGDATQLLPFSDEDVCRALCAAATPVVVAIGHEGDRPLCDEVADLRCGTPSIAAAAVVPSRVELEAELERLRTAAAGRVERTVEGAGRRLAAVDRDRAARVGVERAGERLRRSSSRLELVHPRRHVADARRQLAAGQRELEALSPRRVLERGYAMVRRADGGAIVRSATDVDPGTRVRIDVAAGSFGAVVEQVATEDER